MSETTPRKVRPDEVADFMKQGGAFNEETRYAPPTDGAFVAWGKTSFRAIAPEELAAAEAPPDAPASAESKANNTEAALEAGSEAPHTALSEPAQAEPALVATAPAPPPPPPPAPPVLQESGPTRAEILAEIEKAREDGRVTGYTQGVAAARQELAETIDALRRIEAQLLAAAEDSLEKNTAVMARHVRRIAQDLAGDVFATIPEMFIARIRKAADMFTRAGMDYTLLISSLDAQALTPALRDEEIFRAIRIVEDPDLPQGGFRLTSRDLEVEDVPELEGEPI